MKTHEINESAGPVGLVQMTRAEFIEVLRNLKNPAAETLSGAGAVSVATKVTRLNATSGTYALTIASGVEEGDEKWILFAPSGVSTAVFNLTGTFWDWSTLSFDSDGSAAALVWIGGKWKLAGGNVNVA